MIIRERSGAVFSLEPVSNGKLLYRYVPQMTVVTNTVVGQPLP